MTPEKAKEQAKLYVNDKVWNGKGDSAVFTPDKLQELIDGVIDGLFDVEKDTESDRKIKGLQKVVQMCFDDACKISGKISKKTAIELMKYAN